MIYVCALVLIVLAPVGREHTSTRGRGCLVAVLEPLSGPIIKVLVVFVQVIGYRQTP